MRDERGDTTAAAYHLQQAGEFEAAVALWHPQMEEEIGRGQGPAARQVFSQIDANRLSAKSGKRLILLRARLYRLTGEAENALENLNSVEWAGDDSLSADAAGERGYFMQLLGDTSGARRAYDAGLETLAGLLQKRARLLVARARLWQRSR